MPGVRQLCHETRARCPYCARSLDLSDFGVELFRRIVKALSRDERVEVEGFGTFRAPMVKGRKVRGLKGNVRLTADKRIIRFRAAARAKALVNQQPEDKDKEATT